MTIKSSTITRRRALSGAATAGLGVPLLAACGDDGADPTASDPTSSATSASSKPTQKSASPGETATSSAPPGDGIATADVPVGGGLVLADEEVVVTQPSAGEFKAFSAVCTHQGCLVGEVADGAIVCPCHGSRFDITTGAPTSDSVAQAPLGDVAVVVDGDRITLG